MSAPVEDLAQGDMLAELYAVCAVPYTLWKFPSVPLRIRMDGSMAIAIAVIRHCNAARLTPKLWPA